MTVRGRRSLIMFFLYTEFKLFSISAPMFSETFGKSAAELTFLLTRTMLISFKSRTNYYFYYYYLHFSANKMKIKKQQIIKILDHLCKFKTHARAKTLGSKNRTYPKIKMTYDSFSLATWLKVSTWSS